MAKKKKISIPPSYLKTGGLFLCALLVGGSLIFGIVHLISEMDYFKVKTVTYDSSLEFLRKRELDRLNGKSIFKVNLLEVQKKLAFKNPQAAEIKIIKQFPDQISIEAKKRFPFAQMRIKNRTIVVDEKGVVLSLSGVTERKLPFIKGIDAKKSFSLGLPLRDRNLSTALSIMRAFAKEKRLSDHSIKMINVSNLSEITLMLSNTLKIIMNKELVEKRTKILGTVLSRGELDLKMVKYIDLRFKEPVIGSK